MFKLGPLRTQDNSQSHAKTPSRQGVKTGRRSKPAFDDDIHEILGILDGQRFVKTDGFHHELGKSVFSAQGINREWNGYFIVEPSNETQATTR
jgi:hypothetical protein